MIAASIYYSEGFQDDANDQRIAEELGLPLFNYISRKKMIIDFLNEGNEFTEENLIAWVGKLNKEIKSARLPMPVTGKAPTIGAMAKNLTHAIKDHASTGFKSASEETIRERLDLCLSCEFMMKEGVFQNRCMKCGCFMKVKARWESSRCPIGKW